MSKEHLQQTIVVTNKGNLNKVFRQLREDRGQTRQQLATQFELSYRQIQDLELGVVGPSFETFDKYLNFFKVQILMYGTKRKKPNLPKSVGAS